MALDLWNTLYITYTVCAAENNSVLFKRILKHNHVTDLLTILLYFSPNRLISIDSLNSTLKTAYE
jgi:hypothetical protein